MTMIELDGASLTIEQLLEIADRGEHVALSDVARARVRASRAVVDRVARSDQPAYGINTGFGSFADVRIAPDALEALQVNLLRSHAAGVGDPLPVRAVRATMALRANVLAKGFSGISVETLEALIALINKGVHPAVPSRGSVGASGDLAPLAHLSLVLIGEGEASIDDDNRGERNERRENKGSLRAQRALRLTSWVPGAEALERAGLKPVKLGPKEGLALINGTQPSTAVLALALAGAEQLARAADIAAALSIDALRGSIHPFEARIHEARPFRGQQTSAANIEMLMRGSGINKSHEFCGKVQDAYSLRCAPQVHGATRDGLWFVRNTVDVEANSATDNPMVFADSGDIVSCGNFHGAPIALAADLLAAAVVPLATISERRTDRLVDPTVSGLPAFLTTEGGVRSGYMLAQVTAAAVASELKTLAHPAGVDTIPTSANKEDHVSMSMTAALKAEQAVSRAREVIAIEILCACQAIDLLAPLETSSSLKKIHALVRSRVPTLDADRAPAPDIAAITELIASSELEDSCGSRVK
ncbi:MAG: histidine ammonia-lyase [Acidobacteria bacterium 13_1_40CM_2_64_6]|nr:MAG: histidine ammonia-lyase [Acidobacteria bacterium 13_1_40CM_65_14]OLD55173.1 MAG: histidine ammonia-lyase [Acidobacteria bacterium 13_1_40CM_2_64_6]